MDWDWFSFFIGWMVGVSLAWYAGSRIIKKARDRIPEEYWPDDLFGL